MRDHGFRFAVIAVPSSAERWQRTAARAAELGYTTLLMPDVIGLLAPSPALAIVAATTDIRVGTWVYAAPLRAPAITAREAHTLSVLTGGRFEMGIGTGRPGMQAELDGAGLTFGSPADRLASVSATIDALRELDGPAEHTPVLVAAGGPRSRALAAQKADIVTFAVGPLTARHEFARMTADLRARAGGRADDIEIAMNLAAVGEAVPPGIERMTGADAETLIKNDSLSLLLGTTTEVIAELQRRRDDLGASYFAVSSAAMQTLAPAVEALTGS